MMIIYKKRFSYIFIYVLSVFSLFIYLYGFFPIEYSSNVKIPDRINVNNNISRIRHIDKLAIIIIDALRFDFVFPNNEQKYMSYTLSSILKNESCLLKAKAHSPTVTMPRLKAITSGAISNYIDVILNFMSSDFKEDNFINIAASNNLKLVFYGDDTWLKLFPDTFNRSEGTTSFFTLDYIEVDKNVTRHLEKEFRNDWDVMILHYLGLDHIGHTEGPSSPLVKVKLEEMDNVVKKFSIHFKSQEKQGLKTMLIVTSDHGMKDSGGHGGVTHAETTVPLISIDHPCMSISGWPEDYLPLQIDIAPTLSALLGLPTPVKSIGKVIPALFHNIHKEKIVKILEENRLQLSQFKNPSEIGWKGDSLKEKLRNWLSSNDRNETVLGQIIEEYYELLNHFSLDLIKSKSDFKMSYLILGVIFIWICFIALLSQLWTEIPKVEHSIHWFLVLGTIFHALSFLSSSFIEEEHQTWYFLWATFCVLSLIKTVKLSKLKKIEIKISWISVAVIHRFLRKLNQTGDKWAFLPDIRTFLNTEEPNMHFPFFFMGIVLVFCCALGHGFSRRQFFVLIVNLYSVISYRIATSSFPIRNLAIHSASCGHSEILLFWSSFAAFVFETIWNKTPFYFVWLVLGSLLLRPHNVILLPAEVFVSRQIHKVFNKSQDILWNSIAHVWLGNLFYFYQGNGNSLANIDVASGFVGLQSYNPLYAGILMILHTSSGVILSYLLSPKLVTVYTVVRLLPLAIYCTSLIFQLHHLFIWSVFSPKLLYETNSTLIILLLIFI